VLFGKGESRCSYLFDYYAIIIMQKHLLISIPQPCHEDWNNMALEAKGRHCNACQKTVIDFTSMTDTQIINFFKTDTQNHCGHFYEDQLDRNIPIPRKEIPWLKYFFTIAIPAFLFSLKSTAQKYIKTEKSLIVTEKKLFSSQNKEMSTIPTITTLPEVRIEDNSYRSRRYGGAFTTTTSTSYFSCKTSGIKVETINELTDKSAITIYPNPITVGNKLNILWENVINNNQLIEIFSIDGKLLQKEILTITSKTHSSFIYTKELTKSLCFLRITNMKTGEKITKEIIVN
jgi:hypothetical protein